MTGNFFLDWATLAVSLHNTILLLWLALTVFLNAERRTPGIGFASGAMLLACVFFVCHTAILVMGVNAAGWGLEWWWRLGWLALVALPFCWHSVTLWYTGFWNRPRTALYHRQKVWFVLIATLTVWLGGTLVWASPLPAFADAMTFDPARVTQIPGLPVFLTGFVTAILLCVALSLDALRAPAPSLRRMGDRARARARPWFIATAALLFVIALFVAGLIAWLFVATPRVMDAALIGAFGWFDLIIAGLIAGTIIVLGQAIALYEVFTGKALPRRGLVRHWRSAVLLAQGYSVVVAWSLALHLRPIYSVLLTAGLMTIFFALFSWRTFTERDHYIRQLRPFVASEKLYEQVLREGATSEAVTQTFRAMCRDVLGAQSAQLRAVGSLATFVPALAYPDSMRAPTPPLDLAAFDARQTIGVALDATHWAIPLWSERGLIGVFVLGEKSDGGIYAQEEIEIARASGERLIDTLASAELARRLLALQRQRLAETQLLDQRARRILHDEVLPQLHAAILAQGANAEAIYLLTDAHRQIANLLRELPTTSAPEVARLGVIGALQRVVEQECAGVFERVTWAVDASAEQGARALPITSAEVVFYAAREAIRNAARYGHGDNATRALHLFITAKCGDEFAVVIADDGVGLHKTNLGERGSGQGLALHSAMLAVVGGTLTIEPGATGGTRVTIALKLESERRQDEI